MGIIEDEVKQLKDVIGNLESRIRRLEDRGTGSPTAAELRMILIGPPGAGKLLPLLVFALFPPAQLSLTCARYREGNSGSQAEGAIFLLPPGMSKIPTNFTPKSCYLTWTLFCPNIY